MRSPRIQRSIAQSLVCSFQGLANDVECDDIRGVVLISTGGPVSEFCLLISSRWRSWLSFMTLKVRFRGYLHRGSRFTQSEDYSTATIQVVLV